MAYYLGIDVGGTNLKYALMDETGRIADQGTMQSPLTSINDFQEVLRSICRQFPQAEALVMSAPGRIDSANNYFYTGGSAKFIHEMPLADVLPPEISLPASVENDGKCAALAELWQGSLKGVRNGAVMTLGTAIGGAVILDGKLYRGSTFAAGEFSYIPTLMEESYYEEQIWGLKCGAGGLVRLYEKTAGLTPGSADGYQFFAAVERQDPLALQVLRAWCRTLANGMLALQSVLDLDRFAIGGGISRQPALLDMLNEVTDELYAGLADYYPQHRPDITACTFGNDANLIGALYYYLYESDHEKKIVLN
ncbi:MAG: ROK family protein [Solobacterium sp.]|nr:ROK family protein [Solobacterium sp.]